MVRYYFEISGITQYLLLNFIEKHFPQLSCSVQSDGLVIVCFSFLKL